MDVSQRISDVPEWFKGAQLNYAENLLKHADQDKVALYAASEYKSCIGGRGDMQDAVRPRSSWTAVVVLPLKQTHTLGLFTFLLFHRCLTLFSPDLFEAHYEINCCSLRFLSTRPFSCTVTHVYVTFTGKCNLIM